MLSPTETARRVYTVARESPLLEQLQPTAALQDVEYLERLGGTLRVDLINPPSEPLGPPSTRLKIYHDREDLTLNKTVPLLDNLGLRVLDQASYGVGPHDGSSPLLRIEVFRVQDAQGRLLDLSAHREHLLEALHGLLTDVFENDPLNRLVLEAGLTARQVALLRSYRLYCTQIDSGIGAVAMDAALLAHRDVARLLYAYFRARFDPDLDGRAGCIEAARDDLLSALSQVSSLADDRLLRRLLDVLEATVRTNYYQEAPYISLKIRSAAVHGLPEPRPLFEILVNGSGVSGLHLRGGLVARGGIRWSDRPDDFRTEVLGLMKTQMAKNVVIVPAGAKGAFILKGAPREREALNAYAREQYRIFIRALLDVTDNVVDGAVVPPPRVVRHDEDDPYLVVAADKGTATFSDVANEEAAARGFWLGDAFASGGSRGYSHKKLGITARGAWECVRGHFLELGIDVEWPFTVAAIGDMSGDVFGNGMLYSRRISLVAAFNHQHVFLDPDPDLDRSYRERQRLFELPRSTWEDYDLACISEGGGVFRRDAREIVLSAQARAILGIDAERMSGEELVRAVLALPVDLLWNGGVGTYVKAAHEQHSEVGDAANDAVRVDASKLRAAVVAEGGNGGLTQRARIEFARRGGRINTDAIDNSAGVDISDHEVNLKILLQPLVASGVLDDAGRDALLRLSEDEVVEHVLRHNRWQSTCLNLAAQRSRTDLAGFRALQACLVEQAGLRPDLEYLPQASAFEKRESAGDGLTCPELAVLLAYTKTDLRARILDSDLPEQPWLAHLLEAYFPASVRERFPQAVRSHRLRREILACEITNRIVDLLGMCFVHVAAEKSGRPVIDVVGATLHAFERLQTAAVTEAIDDPRRALSVAAQHFLLERTAKAAERLVLAALRPLPLSDAVVQAGV